MCITVLKTCKFKKIVPNFELQRHKEENMSGLPPLNSRQKENIPAALNGVFPFTTYKRGKIRLAYQNWHILTFESKTDFYSIPLVSLVFWFVWGGFWTPTVDRLACTIYKAKKKNKLSFSLQIPIYNVIKSNLLGKQVHNVDKSLNFFGKVKCLLNAYQQKR